MFPKELLDHIKICYRCKGDKICDDGQKIREEAIAKHVQESMHRAAVESGLLGE